MADTLLRQVALVSESDRVDPSDLTRVSAALQKQAARDLVQFWNVKVTVDAFPRLEDVPIGYWPMIVKDDIEQSGAAGIHLDQNGQPFALVTASDQLDVWSLTASHELIEMLLDPFGNRLIAGDSPKRDQKRVQFLLEACDPSEAADFAYTVNGVLVSDFYTIRFFDPVAVQGVRYSFTGAIREPRQVLRGGYLSWHDPASDIWWQETWFGGNKPVFRSLGRLSASKGSFRSQIDRMTSEYTAQTVSGGAKAARAAGLPVAAATEAGSMWTASLRRQIEELTGAGSGRGDPLKQREPAEEPGPAESAAAAWRPEGRRAEGRRTASGRRGGNGPADEALRAPPSVWDDWRVSH